MRTRVLLLSVCLVIAACGDDAAAPPTGSTIPPVTPAPPATPAPTTTTPPRPPTTTPTTAAPDGARPPLVVETPVDGTSVTAEWLRYEGRTEPAATVDAATRYPATVEADGRWSIVLRLTSGWNVTTFSATDAAGNRADVRVRVYRDTHPDLVGQVLRTVWEREGELQRYDVGDQPTGLYAGVRLPLEYGRTWLGTAERSGIGWNRGPYDTAFDGAAMVLTLAGYDGGEERFLVADLVPVHLPARAGVLAALDCQARSHVVRLAFTDRGPVVAEAWRVDLGSHRFVPVAPAESGCPDLAARPVDADGTGLVVTAADVPAAGPRRYLDLSGPSPRLTAFHELAGMDLGLGGGATLLEVADLGDPELRRVWLGQLLGWDHAGAALFRITTALRLVEGTDLPAGTRVVLDCWVPRAGARAVGLGAEDQTGARVVPVRAWRVENPSGPAGALVEIDPSPVSCALDGE